jgi:hypothetical protein
LSLSGTEIKHKEQIQMKGTEKIARRTRLAAQTVALTVRIAHAKLEVIQLAARYGAFGLEPHEVPGLGRALGMVRSLMAARALVELELAGA